MKLEKWDVAFMTAAYFDVVMADLVGPSHRHFLTHPRQIVMYLCRSMLNKSTPDIGAFLNRDHTTILNGSKRISAKAGTDPILVNDISNIRQALILLSSRLDLPPNMFARREMLKRELYASRIVELVANYIARISMTSMHKMERIVSKAGYKTNLPRAPKSLPPISPMGDLAIDSKISLDAFVNLCHTAHVNSMVETMMEIV